MADNTLEQTLVDHPQDMDAPERAGQHPVRSALSPRKHDEILQDLPRHREETDHHVELLHGRPRIHGGQAGTRVDEHRVLVIDRSLIDDGIEVAA